MRKRQSVVSKYAFARNDRPWYWIWDNPSHLPRTVFKNKMGDKEWEAIWQHNVANGYSIMEWAQNMSTVKQLRHHSVL